MKTFGGNMKIPIPCNFGEKAYCNGKELPFKEVNWFKWSWGMEYTYFFSTNDYWQPTDFYTTLQCDSKNQIEIPDFLLEDGLVKDKGFPLKGRGYAYGLYYADGKTYIDFIITSNYFAHIKVQCDSAGAYIPNGNIIFPIGWDTDEKIEQAMLKSIKFITGKPLVIKAKQPEQMSIFDFIIS